MILDNVGSRAVIESNGGVFEDLDFEAVDDPERQGTVGVARFIGPPRALIDEHLFTFNRDRL